MRPVVASITHLANRPLESGDRILYHLVLRWLMGEADRARVFKSAWFSKAARKALIRDSELCDAIRQVMLGQADDLGGGVFKKRLNKNRYRSIVLAKGGRHWMYEYLFAKQDRENIDDDELSAFRSLAKAYATLTEAQLSDLLANGDLQEICHADEA